jgi:hypothetical protein
MLDAMLRDFAKDGVESWAEIGRKVWNLINLKEKFSQQDKYLITLIDVVVVVVAVVVVVVVVSVATFGLIVAFVVTVVAVSVTVLVVMSVL